MSNALNKKKMFVAAVAAAGFAVISIAPPMMIAADPPSAKAPAEVDQPLNLPDGFQTKDINADSGVRSGLVKLTDRAVTKGGFNSLLAELASQDKERAREFKGADQTKLDSVIDQIQKQWKDKYGVEFKIDDKNLVFNDKFPIAQGQVTDPALAVNDWPVASAAGEAVTAGDRSKAASDKKNADAAKLTKGTDVALIRFPGSHDEPAMTVSLIHQLLFWRVDIPNDRTGEQIYDDLLGQLNYIQSHGDKWPTNVNDAYRMVAHHAVAALYGVQSQETEDDAANAEPGSKLHARLERLPMR